MFHTTIFQGSFSVHPPASFVVQNGPPFLLPWHFLTFWLLPTPFLKPPSPHKHPTKSWPLTQEMVKCVVWGPVVWGPRIGVPLGNNPFHFGASQESKPPQFTISWLTLLNLPPKKRWQFKPPLLRSEMALAPQVAGIPRSLVTNFHHKSDFHRSQPQLLAVGPDESKAAKFPGKQTRKPSCESCGFVGLFPKNQGNWSAMNLGKNSTKKLHNKRTNVLDKLRLKPQKGKVQDRLVVGFTLDKLQSGRKKKSRHRQCSDVLGTKTQVVDSYVTLYTKKQVDSDKPLPVWTNRAPQKFRRSNHTFCVKAGESLVFSFLVICWAAKKGPQFTKRLFQKPFFSGSCNQPQISWIEVCTHQSVVWIFHWWNHRFVKSCGLFMATHLWTGPTQVLLFCKRFLPCFS